MVPDDVVYALILISSFGLGYYTKTITDPETKRLTCAGAGLFLALVTCHIHIYHTLVMIFGSCILIKLAGPRYKFLKTSLFVLFGNKKAATSDKVHCIRFVDPSNIFSQILNLLTLDPFPFRIRVHYHYYNVWDE